MSYIVTFDLEADADYDAAHEALARAGMKRELHGSQLPRSTVFCPGDMPGDVIGVVRALLKGFKVTRIAVGNGGQAWTRDPKLVISKH